MAELRRKPADAVVSLDRLFRPLIGARAAGVPFASRATRISLFGVIPGVPPVENEESKKAAMVFQVRLLLIRKRTQAISALRGHLTECGQIALQGAFPAAGHGNQAEPVRDADQTPRPSARLERLGSADENL